MLSQHGRSRPRLGTEDQPADDITAGNTAHPVPRELRVGDADDEGGAPQLA